MGDGKELKESTSKEADSKPEKKEKEKKEKKEKKPEVTVEIPFPEDKTGLLFGKNASNLKYMKQRSKARVFVDVPALVVRVSGTERQVENARKLVQKILEREPKKKEEEATETAVEETMTETKEE